MAIFKPLLGDLRGKLGGVVFQRGRGTQIVRAWVRNVDPHTAAQSYARNRLSQASRRWHALTDEQKANWETYAATIYAPRDGRPPGAVYTGQMAYTGARILALSAIEHSATTVLVNDPPGANVTLLTQQVPILAPAAVFSATWKVDGVARTVALVAAMNPPQTHIEITLGWEGAVTAASAPDPTDQTSGEKWGVILLASLNSQQVHGRQPRPRSYVVAAVPPLDSIVGWAPSNHITLQVTIPPTVAERLRYVTLAQGAYRLTAVAVSQLSAQARVIGDLVVAI